MHGQQYIKKKIPSLDTLGLEDFTLTALIVCLFGVVECCDSEVRTAVKMAVVRTPNGAVCGFL